MDYKFKTKGDNHETKGATNTFLACNTPTGHVPLTNQT